MFDIAPSEFLLIAIVAIVVIGPKDLPMALRTAGKWIAKVRRVSNHFKSGIETMIREAEMEEMEKKWREQNAAIMAANPPAEPAAVVDAAGVVHPVIEHTPIEHGPVDPLIAAHAPTEPAAAPITHPDHPA
jgi:sec-independent protein translocase protein TatB